MYADRVVQVKGSTERKLTTLGVGTTGEVEAVHGAAGAGLKDGKTGHGLPASSRYSTFWTLGTRKVQRWEGETEQREKEHNNGRNGKISCWVAAMLGKYRPHNKYMSR
jgi:hypothetical protein